MMKHIQGTATKAVGERQIRVIASAEVEDRMGDIVRVAGIDLTQYRKNPVVLFAHEHGQPIARCSEVKVEGSQLVGTIDFPAAGTDAQSDRIVRLLKTGVLSAVSIGFMPKRWERLESGGLDIVESELYEISVVSVPANQEALVLERAAGRHDANHLETLSVESDAIALLERTAPNMPHTAPAFTRTAEQPGLGFARMVRALVAGRGSGREAAAFAEAQPWSDKYTIARALGASSGSAGGFLVPNQLANEAIEALRAASVVTRAGATILDMTSGRASVPRIDAGATSSYAGENKTQDGSEPTLGNVVLTSKRLIGIVPLSNDLFRNSGNRADAAIRDDLGAGMAVTADAAFIRGDGGDYTPKGMRYWAASGNVRASIGASVANIETDLKALIAMLRVGKVRMLRPAWLMNGRSFERLYELRDANGNLIFPELRDVSADAPNGRLWSHPVLTTNSIPTNLGGGSNESEVYLFDAADALIGEETALEIAASDVAAYSVNGTVVSAASLDQTVIRAVMRHDFAMRHDVSVAVLTGVTWGA